MSNNPDFLQQSGLAVSSVYYDFVEASVIPATAMQREMFWDTFASLVASANGHYSSSTGESAVTSGTRIPVRACSQPVDAAWGSLYDALYSDNVIPHTAGLKPGSRVNIARRERVIRCGKDFLDTTFPLSEGSHRHAISYMAYFQNLLVILADGSTTGLQNPKQFVAKNGPSDSPDSILLEHNGTHTEISFDRNGKIGASDLATIDDIQLESAIPTLFDFEANSAGEKCDAYQNWIAIVTSQRNRTFSSRDGEVRSMKNSNWAIASTGTTPCSLVIKQDGSAVADWVVDAITATIIESAYSNNLSTVRLCATNAEAGTKDTFITELQQFLSGMNEHRGTTAPDTIVKVISTSADNAGKPARPVIGTVSDSERVPSPVTATIDTMQSHGYDVKQAIAF